MEEIEEFKYLVSIISFLHDSGAFPSKGEARRMLKQGGITLHLSDGTWKPSEHAGMIFSSDHRMTSRIDDCRIFLNLLK